MAVVGGTASALGGGKFSNGAVSGAFVHMFNAEAGNSIRQKLIIDRASKILSDGRLPKNYANKLRYLIKTKGIFYSDRAEHLVSVNGNLEMHKVFGLGLRHITLTTLIWDRFSGNGLNDRIDYDIVHELQHVVNNSASHPSNFESNINRSGYYKGGILDAF